LIIQSCTRSKSGRYGTGSSDCFPAIKGMITRAAYPAQNPLSRYCSSPAAPETVGRADRPPTSLPPPKQVLTAISTPLKWGSFSKTNPPKYPARFRCNKLIHRKLQSKTLPKTVGSFGRMACFFRASPPRDSPTIDRSKRGDCRARCLSFRYRAAPYIKPLLSSAVLSFCSPPPPVNSYFTSRLYLPHRTMSSTIIVL
jgi:hypothetical protein